MEGLHLAYFHAGANRTLWQAMSNSVYDWRMQVSTEALQIGLQR